MKQVLRAIADLFFRADDARAAAYGWQAEPGKHGLSRTYRDPRFDLRESIGAEPAPERQEVLS